MARKRNGAIAWMAHNPVAANLLMFALLGIGLISSLNTKQEVFPTYTPAQVRVTFAYPGASPEEVEQGILLAVEEATRGLDGVKRVESTASEGLGSISVIVMDDADLDRALSDVKVAIDRLRSLPEDAERPVVNLIQPKQRTVSVIVHGNADRATLRTEAERIRTGLIRDTEVTQAELNGAPALEIAIEIKPERLRQYGLQIDELARRIRQASVELPSGRIRSEGGEILLRTTERRTLGTDFGQIVILSNADGTQVKLSDLAEIKDGFAEIDQETTFNGLPSIGVDVYRVGRQTPTGISKQTKRFLKTIKLPPGISAKLVNDRSEMFQDRIDLLLRNAFSGLILVFVSLSLFLELRLAFWVMLGIPISFLGAFVLLPGFDASINMVSMFAFILVLGIVVDDAIVVGESIFQKRQEGLRGIDAAIEGAKEVGTPVVFAVLTTIVAFGPLLLVPGFTGAVFGVIPIVVCAVLVLSLVESLLILPAHLAHSQPRDTGVIAAIARWPSKVSRGLERFIKGVYVPIARLCARHRYTTVAFALATVLLTAGYVRGVMRFTFLPKIESDFVVASARLPVDGTFERTKAIRDRLVAGAKAAIAKHGGMDFVRSLNAGAGQSIRGFGPRVRSSQGAQIAEVAVQLVQIKDREFTAQEFAASWREAVGELIGVENTSFTYSIGRGSGRPIAVRLSHPETETLERAAMDLVADIGDFPGAEDVDQGFSNGKAQLDARLTPLGRAVGLTETALARQLRSFFYGAEVLRQQRGRDEVKVMVRLPRAYRDRVSTLDNLMLRTPDGSEIPLRQAATLAAGRAYSQIGRVDGQRVITVSAEIDEAKTTSDRINGTLRREVLTKLKAEYPGLTYSFEGESRERRESFSSMAKNSALALLLIFGLLAIPFKSYVQPLLVMSAIPFGFVGAVWGHVAMGYDLSVISMMGFIALSGVVVNDSLIMIVATNRFRDAGASPVDAVVQGGARRFRPILLTSLTTFFVLLPMIFETSVQAKFLIPMALSLGFGVLWATVIILIFVPAFYVILEDLKVLLFKTDAGEPVNEESAESTTEEADYSAV
ncbi:MAG: efflux RND transporter permease subunit [Myxococcota bacterium]|nr:efflux RND transporter permease subunit [Myxococcota bacterium]